MLGATGFQKKLYLAAIPVVILLLFMLVITISRIGETKVRVTVVPQDASLDIDGKAAKAGNNYLKQGTHTFTAKHSGYSNDSRVVDVGAKSQDVGLIPAPSSEKAIQFLQDNPEIAREREAIGGAEAAKQGIAAEQQTPIIKLLPITSIQDLYSIDFGPSPSRKNGTFLLINDSSPQGRVNGLKWIKQQGYNPADLEIRYQDFVNPILTSSEYD